jgi:hypothetical protein
MIPLKRTGYAGSPTDIHPSAVVALLAHSKMDSKEGVKCRILANNGEIYESHFDEIEVEKIVDNFMRPLIPAAPGYYGLRWIPPNDEDPDGFLLKEEIIAWRDTRIGLEPVVLWANDAEEVSILTPSGAVIEPHNARWESLDNWLTEQREEYDKKAKAEA